MRSSNDRRARAALLDRLAAFPGRLNVAADALLGTTPEPGEWTSQQVILHLVAVETEVFQRRLRDLARVADPEWSWVEPGPAAMDPDETTAQSCDRFAAARAATLDDVRALTEAGWRRSGRHATLGALDVTGVLALAADHDAEHFAALVKLGGASRRGAPKTGLRPDGAQRTA